jgi:hypothetical protein
LENLVRKLNHPGCRFVFVQKQIENLGVDLFEAPRSQNHFFVTVTVQVGASNNDSGGVIGELCDKAVDQLPVSSLPDANICVRTGLSYGYDVDL